VATLGGVQTFRLARPFVFFLAFGAAFFIFVVVGVIGQLDEGTQESRLFFLVWLLFVGAWLAWASRNIAHRVTVGDAGAVTFHMLARHVELSSLDILAIRPSRLDPLRQAGLLVMHRGGRLRIPYQLEGLFRLVSTLHALNPRIDVSML
jgi:hypothetical protein